MFVFGQYTLLFFVYSFIGGIVETAFRFAIDFHIYPIHGFLHLPILPIYGFGAIIILLMVRLLKLRNPIAVFFMSAILTSVLEFVSSWLIELIFHTRIWDYTGQPFSLDGRVSLFNSVGFGVIALILVYVLHPLLTKVMKKIPAGALVSASFIVLAVLLADIITSIIQRLAA